ncbi:hypothetical protein GQ44DRAFT_720126 [Phaeosphaeriaceae sp. PMI808]|nr:hypothetical protein GQ44DRAFT_720126 [Phaeosphaeriaceae sp. PMI808]
MAAATAMPSSILGTFNYIKHPEEGEPWLQHYIPGSAGIHRFKLEPHDMKVVDIRTLDEPPKWDVHGFQHLNGVKPVDRKIFDEEEKQIADAMCEEAVELLKKVTGASFVLCFNHVTRFESPKKVKTLPSDMPDDSEFSYMGPLTSVHVDQSYRGGRYMLENFKRLPEVAARMDENGVKCRVATINVWRPVSLVTRDALAVCDRRTVDDQDFRPWESHPYPGQWDPAAPLPKSEVWRPFYNAKNKWYYVSNMRPDEALLIKCFDTKMDEYSRAVPHGAFTSKIDHGLNRESVEFRCLVFWDDEPFCDKKAFENPRDTY